MARAYLEPGFACPAVRRTHVPAPQAAPARPSPPQAPRQRAAPPRTHTMPSIPADAASPTRPLQALDKALDQSHDVKAEVEACAEDLGSANELAKARIAAGSTALPAAEVLKEGLAVERQVQGFAEDLQQVTDNLAHGVAEVKAVEQALGLSRDALAESEAALAASRSAERMASQRAMHDQKTGLPNRTLFDDRLAQAVAGAERHGRMLAVMFLDLDRFKLVNDSHGHAAGDAVLTVVAERLMRNSRDEDTVCRNGGDEFLYLLIDPCDRETVARIAVLVREAIAAPISVGALQFTITPSIGIALYPEHGQGVQTLIEHADAAMYRAKQAGKPFEFFEPAMALNSALR
jgi:diguanylate cyclase